MIVVVGEALVDVVVSPEGGTTRRPGGSPLNVAIGLARLGETTGLVSRVGDDDHGDLIREHLRASRVELLSESSAGPTGVATARLAASGDATYEFTLEWDLPPTPLPEGASALHFGSLGALLAPGAEAVAALVEEAHAAGLPTSFDPNIRPALTPDAEAAWSQVCRLAGMCDLVRLSEEDAAFLRPDLALSDVAAQFLDCGSHAVVITSGDGPTLALSRRGEAAVASPGAEVVDTVGAGDSFMAALVAATLPRRLDAQSWQPTSDELTHDLTAAHQAAAITVSRAAADPPWRHELGPDWPGQP
jgi:fructokinase